MANRIELWDLDALHPYENNPRTHSEEQLEQIAASIQEFGFNNPILVDGDAGIIAGHGRLLAARRLGLEQVPVVVLDYLTPAQRRAYLIADNQIAANAGWDEPLLIEELRSLEAEDADLSLLGFSDEDLASLLDQIPDLDPAVDHDVVVPDPPENPVTRAGDLWAMGRHRLLCGDSTDPAVVARIMAEARADMVFTDPPYNVSYVGKTKDQLTIENDAQEREAFALFLRTALFNLREALKPGGVFYVCAPAGPDETVFRLAIEDVFQLRQCLVWAKDVFVLGRQDYHWRHESILYGWNDGAAHYFVDDRTQDTVWEIPRPRSSREHPTMKPVALVQRAIANSSHRGGLVLDLFGGSGTTLIASEVTERQARVIELDPRYVDVCVQRWEEMTGSFATLGDTGLTFSELRQERSHS